MALMKLAQIAGGTLLRSDVDALKNSYQAAKVLTDIAKTGDNAGKYNVNELLLQLKENIAAITGADSQDVTSLKTLKAAIDAINAKKVKDPVRMELAVANGKATIPSDLATKVPGVDTSKALPVYTLDNEVLVNENGQQLTVDLTTGAFNGTPSIIDQVETAKKENGEIVYKAATLTSVKVFPEGEWTFGSLPTDALLDNTEVQALAYKSALDKVVAKLAQDDTLIASVKALIGEQTVQDQLTATTNNLQTKIDKKFDAASVVKTADTSAEGHVAAEDKVLSEAAVEAKFQAAANKEAADIAAAKKAAEDGDKTLKTAADALTTRVAAIEAAEEQEVTDKVAVTSATAVTAFTLAKKPTAELVRAFINGIAYFEGEDFTVDRSAKTATWTATAAAGGFNITNDLTDKVIFVYNALKA